MKNKTGYTYIVSKTLPDKTGVTYVVTAKSLAEAFQKEQKKINIYAAASGLKTIWSAHHDESLKCLTVTGPSNRSKHIWFDLKHPNGL